MIVSAAPYSQILRRFSDVLGQPVYAAKRQRNMALLAKMRSLDLPVRQDRGRDWEHIHTALHVGQSYRRGTRILDVGGGGSLFSFELALSGYDVTVIDIDPRVVEIVQANARSLGIGGRLRADRVDTEQRWTYPDASFDAVVSISVFEGLTRRQRQRFFAEVHRTLKLGGELFLTFDYGSGARLLGDPPVDIDAVMDEIVHSSGLELEDPIPPAPDAGAMPMSMVLPDIGGIDFTTAQYTFGAVRLRKQREAGPSFPERAPRLPADVADPALLLELLRSAPGIDHLRPVVIAFETIDENAPGRIVWNAHASGVEITTSFDRQPDVVFAATPEVLTRLLRNPEEFWHLQYADVLFTRGDFSAALRYLDRLPVLIMNAESQCDG